MQTKNINVDPPPNSTEGNDVSKPTPEKTYIILHNPGGQQKLGVPPLPPRTSVIFTALPSVVKPQVEVEGYGPYKPVPPPKPLPQQPPQQRSDCLTPPPYRMPPYPLYNEPTIPGATGLDHPIASSSPPTPQGLHTHSSKFPIEREVILSSTDKNSKIPILHEYKKRTKGAIAPDAPPKQMAAWTQGQNHQILPDQNHAGLIQTIQQTSEVNPTVYRATYHNNTPSDYYNGGQNTGAVPRSTTYHDPTRTYRAQNDDYPTNLTPNTQHQNNGNNASVAVQIDSKDPVQKDNQKINSKGMTKTYHTIKDIISSRFKSSKDNNDDKEVAETGLNNVAEELRKSQANIVEELESKKTFGDQGIYGKPATVQQLQYNQHVIQQQILVHQAQQYQQHQQLKSHHQQQQQYTHQLAQARSQEILGPSSRVDDQQVFYQGYTGQSRTVVGRFVPPPSGREQNFVQMQSSLQMSSSKEVLTDHQAAFLASERRSAQQLERDNLRQRSFEARRAASQPHLSFDDDDGNDTENKPQPQIAALPLRRGSHGNIMEATTSNGNSCNQQHQPRDQQQQQQQRDQEKDSDDGGFLHRVGSKEKRLDTLTSSTGPQRQQKVDGSHGNSEVFGGKSEQMKVVEALQGTPRKKLEGEIGKIEGVYNVGQRSAKPEEEQSRLTKKANPSSANSSDYDKTGGQSSSNVDSGRGSAAYSSGRRPLISDLNGETLGVDLAQGSSRANYRDLHGQGHDNEWVDIVENELRHILEPKLHELSLHGNIGGMANSTMSESISSMTPPLPPLSPGDQSSPNMTPKNMNRHKHSSLPYGSKPDYDGYKSKTHSKDLLANQRWNPSSSQKHRSTKKMDHNVLLRGKQIFGLDTTDLTSTTTRSLDLESMLDNQSDSDEDISTTDARTIRKQLEGLETMYSEVLKLLGVNKKHGGRYQPSDPRFSKRRYGSMSSLPSSSVSSRPIRDKRRVNEDRKKVRDIRGINKRFQRLESHVVTLARSVAHLSSEMRTQHLMIQEMENIRGEIAALRTQTNMLNVRSQSASRPVSCKELPSLSNPTRVKKLTKFFGDEPPLLRLFLRKLGYEKYANVFENEKVGMVELPYLSEERLQKMGVPLGPRLRIMQEAQISVCKENTLCIV